LDQNYIKNSNTEHINSHASPSRVSCPQNVEKLILKNNKKIQHCFNLTTIFLWDNLNLQCSLFQLFCYFVTPQFATAYSLRLSSFPFSCFLCLTLNKRITSTHLSIPADFCMHLLCLVPIWVFNLHTRSIFYLFQYSLIFAAPSKLCFHFEMLHGSRGSHDE
jgi:hypothetical protein